MKQVFCCVFGFFLNAVVAFGQSPDSTEVVRVVDSLINRASELMDRKFEEALIENDLAQKLTIEYFGRSGKLYARCQHNKGAIFYFKGKYPEAEQIWLETLSIWENAVGKESDGYAKTANGIAAVYLNTGRYANAEAMLLEVMSIQEKISGKVSLPYALVLNNLSSLYVRTGRYEEAEPMLLEAKNIRGQLAGKQSADYATCLHNIGQLYINTGRLQEAFTSTNEALLIRERVLGVSHSLYASSLGACGNICSRLGEFEKAEKFLLKAISIIDTTIGRGHPEALTLVNILTGLYVQTGQFDAAKILLNQTLSAWENSEKTSLPQFATLLNIQGNLYRKMGLYKQAETILLESIERRKKIFGANHIEVAIATGSLANLYYQTKSYEKAEFYYQQVSSIFAEKKANESILYANSLNNLASVYFEMGRFQEALKCIEEAITIKTQIVGAESFDLVSSLSNYSVTLAALNRMKESETKFIELKSLEQSLILKFSVYFSTKELENFVALFDQRQSSLPSIIFRNAINGQSLSSTAYSNILFYKGFLLNAAATLRTLASQDSMSARIYSQLASKRFLIDRELSKPIADRVPYLQQWEQDANIFEKELVRTVPGYAEAIRPVNWEEVKATLGNDEVAIEFVSFRLRFPQETDSVLYAALVLRPDVPQPVFVPLCEQRQLDLILSANRPSNDLELPDFFQNQYASPRADGLPSLYQLLWKPLEPHLKNIKTVYFSPDGELHRINMAAIAPNKSGKVLADRYHFVPLASTRQLVIKKSGADTIHSAVVFGGAIYEMDSAAIRKANRETKAMAHDTTGGWFNWLRREKEEITPEIRGDNWQYLPGTLREAVALDSVLNIRGIHSTLLTGYAATEESVKKIAANGQPSPGLLHIGTHGFFFSDPQLDTSGYEPVFKISEYPMIRAGLLLSGAKYAWEKGHPMGGMEDQILTALDVSRLNLRQTYLTVFSACETGLGEIRGHEGVFGLQRATRLAGARNLIMSLWWVRDDASEAFLGHFYANWLEQKMPLRDAFEETQMWMRSQEKYESPFFWAGFILIGEP